jgi:hypothetical protein
MKPDYPGLMGRDNVEPGSGSPLQEAGCPFTFNLTEKSVQRSLEPLHETVVD